MEIDGSARENSADGVCRMELPNSVVALLIAAFAILPGVPGERLYTMLVGWDWREDKWWRTLRLLAFSLVGLSI
jgi:hypothetical protein